MAELGVNVDHVATIRQARKTYEPDPVFAAGLAVLGGADGITVHLREDRRHIQERDVRILRETVAVKLNLEMACVEEVIEIACGIRPDQVTLVPERREEVTTEGGLDAAGHSEEVASAMRQLQGHTSAISLFLDPEPNQIEAARQLGAEAVELHTGGYAIAASSGRERDRDVELSRLVDAAALIRECGMTLHAGHGLNYHNVKPIARIEGMGELNIGHSIVARAVFVGMEAAVREMKRLIEA